MYVWPTRRAVVKRVEDPRSRVLNNVLQHSGSEYKIKKETQKIIRSFQFVHDEK